MENRLTACMMVKDEAHNLDRCLSSLQHFVDHIVVVDTGSTDESPDICKRYGASVFFHPFEGKIIDDFSKYRNLSIGYAQTNWVMIIDADEQIEFQDVTRETLREKIFLSDPEISGFLVTLKDIQHNMHVMMTNTARIFRKEDIRYDDIVHNQPRLQGKCIEFLPGLVINHYGYDLTDEQFQAKGERITSLLLKRIKEDPADHLAYFFLNQHYASRRDYRKAVYYGEKYFTLKSAAERDGRFMTAIYFTMIRGYMHLENQEKAHEWLERGAEALPQDLDIARCIVEYGSWVGNWRMVMNGAENFVSLYHANEENPALRGNRFLFSLNPEALAFVLFNLVATLTKSTNGAVTKLRSVLPQTHELFCKGMTQDLDILLKTDLGVS